MVAVRTTVLIVDDHPGFRSLVRRVLESSGFSVVGEVGDGESALDAVGELAPQLVLLDVQLPGLDGIEVARRLSSRPAPPAVVLISTRDAADYGPLLDECGARGFMSKGELSAGSLSALLAKNA